ncbi:hypothetical protein M9H77_07154 [Catharanthus roseus]|uniref:Uncharacterized protein n=1 Tax=Catharanthus roseus TaxID=4058 RepID=A0ACC0BU51_CATRO|nr:hypothetical protein M9H77_07154 [Catharanthus roseus]
MHERPIWDALEKRDSLRYKDLIDEVRADGGMVARGQQVHLVGVGHSLSGGRKWVQHLHNQSCTSYCISKRDSGLPVAATRAMSTVLAHNLQPSLRSNGEAAITRHRFHRIFCGYPRVLHREGEEVVGVHAAGTGQVRRLHDLVRFSVWCGTGFSTHYVPSFPSD